MPGPVIGFWSYTNDPAGPAGPVATGRITTKDRPVAYGELVVLLIALKELFSNGYFS